MGLFRWQAAYNGNLRFGLCRFAEAQAGRFRGPPFLLEADGLGFEPRVRVNVQ